jgi:hypothetical protein
MGPPMTTQTRSFIVFVAALALAMFAEAVAEPHQIQAFRLIWLLAGAAIASAMKIELPKMDGNMSVNLPFILMAAAKLSLLETLLIAIACASVQMALNRRVPTLAQAAFNLSNTMVSAGCAFFTIQRYPTADGEATPIYIRVGLAAITYCLVNTGLMAFVLKLVQGGSFRKNWRTLLGITIPYYAVGGMLGAMMSITARYLSWEYTVFAIPVMATIYWSYQQLVSLAARREPQNGGPYASAASAT